MVSINPNKTFSSKNYPKIGDPKISSIIPRPKSPIRLVWEITKNCNFSCNFCYVYGDKNVRKDLSFDEMCNIIKQASDMEVFYFVLLGGEPLLRKEFYSIIREIREYDMYSTVITNGYLIKQQLAALKLIPPMPVVVSLHDNPMDYAKYMNLDDLSIAKRIFDQIVENIRLLGSENKSMGSFSSSGFIGCFARNPTSLHFSFESLALQGGEEVSNVLNLKVETLGLLYSLKSAMGILAGFLILWVGKGKKESHAPLFRVSLSSMLLSYLLFAGMHAKIIGVLALALYALGEAIYFTGYTLLINDVIPNEYRSTIISTRMSVSALVGALFYALIGRLVNLSGLAGSFALMIPVFAFIGLIYIWVFRMVGT